MLRGETIAEKGDRSSEIVQYSAPEPSALDWQQILDRSAQFVADLPEYAGNFFTEYQKVLVTLWAVSLCVDNRQSNAGDFGYDESDSAVGRPIGSHRHLIYNLVCFPVTCCLPPTVKNLQNKFGFADKQMWWAGVQRLYLQKHSRSSSAPALDTALVLVETQPIAQTSPSRNKCL